MYKRLFLFATILFCLVSCTEHVDTSARYVFKDPTALNYLQKHPETYSTYVDLLFKVHVSDISETTVGQLLSARGHYTVFAPNNKAIQDYLEELVDTGIIARPSFEAFDDSTKLDSIRKVIVLNSIIDSGDNDNPFAVSDFPLKNGEEFMIPNMNDRKLSVYYGGVGIKLDEEGFPIGEIDSILINNKCPLNYKNRDIPVINGYIHQVEKVITCSMTTLADYFQDVIEKKSEPYLVMAKAVQACGLMDTMRAVRDEVYETKYKKGLIKNLVGMTSHGFAEGNTAYVPQHRKYGFTVFAETDDFWREQGLDPESPDILERLQEWVLNNHQYSDEDQFEINRNYKNENNLLYQWLTYHILPMRISAAKLVFHENEYGYNADNPGVLATPVYDLYTTYGKRRLLKIYESRESNGIYLNRFPKLDNGRHGTNHELYCEPNKVGCKVGKEDPRAIITQTVNACIYPIDAPLAYSDDVRDNLHKQRMRIDVMTLFPEAMSNDLRKNHLTDEKYQHVYIPERTVYPYFENMWTTEGSYFVYYNAYREYYSNLYFDEVKCVGFYDVTFKLPPVPRKGTYEIRWGYDANPRRGMAQVFLGKSRDKMFATDIPLDMRYQLYNPETGFEYDTGDDDYDSEVDKRMRNNGYMKAGKGWCHPQNAEWTGRNPFLGGSAMRRIIFRGFLDPDETYYIRMKSVLDSDRTEFMMDLLEYCAKEVYDNPEEPEDIW
ncbi:MAG: fasciclin domain-containing protein [Bacteroidaceae bacterium]|nr:fasciclin domain-containing protein [Bacteroidaceae bacterium]